MNKRIKELAEQAGFQYIKDESIGWAGNHNASLPKFAELIVRECASICEKDGRWWAEKGYLMEAGEAGSLAKQIKEHFGVEE